MAPTVLITGMGSNTAISVAKALRRQSELNLRIVGTDIHAASGVAGRAFCDVLYRVPNASDPGYVAVIEDLCRREDVKVVFPIVDPEIEQLARASDRFAAAGIALWASSHDTVRTCNDKRLTASFLRERGFATPPSWTPAEAAAKRSSLPYPLIIKPARGVSSQGVVHVGLEAELEAALGATKDPVIEQYLDGPEYTLDYLADGSGAPLACVPRRRLETKAGISTKGATERLPDLESEAMRLAQALDIRGPCNLQCRLVGGRPVFFDINPRFSGALPLTVAAGVNGPLILTKLALGLPIEPRELQWQDGVIMARYWEEVFWRPGDV